MHHLHNTQTEVTFWYNVWQRPNKHPIKMPVVLYMYIFLKNIFITETNNYTKRILHSPTDHYINTRATNWKKLTTEGLHRFIACHRSRQTKNKTHMLVRKIHHSNVLGAIIFPKDNFQLNLTCFHMVAKNNFAVVHDTYLSVVFITPPPIWPLKRTLVPAE